MGSHPVNLAVRFMLELAALIAMGVWGWRQGEGTSRYILALLVPLAAALVWVIFAVPGDPSWSGSAPAPVPGAVRLGIEAAFFVFSIWALFQSGHMALAITLTAAIVVHYAVSYDRLAWLLRT